MPARLTPRARLAAGLVAAASLVLAGCAHGGGSAPPTWVPQPDLATAVEPQPELPQGGNVLPEPQPSLPGGGGPGGNGNGGNGNGGGGSSGPSATPTPGGKNDPNVVATHLNQPTALVIMPDGTALVGERTTGRILRVQPQPGKPVRLEQTLTGLDASGDGGLLDLALSPSFNQDGLLYAYITTPTDNRVVHFALGTTPTPVLTGIPKGRTGNGGRITFDDTGALITGTGDAGNPLLAQNPTNLAGKILRTDDLGHPDKGNPDPSSAVYARGLRTVDGLCTDPTSGARLAISTSPRDEVNAIKRGGDAGWPTASLRTMTAAGTLPAGSGGGGCTVGRGQLVVAGASCQCLLMSPIATNGSFKTFTKYIQKVYGRLRTVVAAPDGALWVTTVNRDGHGKPTGDDDRVVRILNVSGGADSVV